MTMTRGATRFFLYLSFAQWHLTKIRSLGFCEFRAGVGRPVRRKVSVGLHRDVKGTGIGLELGAILGIVTTVELGLELSVELARAQV